MAELTREPDVCRCLRCSDCGGSGRVEVKTGSYPEWDLESCPECEGTGISEMCRLCSDAEDRAREAEEL